MEKSIELTVSGLERIVKLPLKQPDKEGLVPDKNKAVYAFIVETSLLGGDWVLEENPNKLCPIDVDADCLSQDLPPLRLKRSCESGYIERRITD